MISDRSGSASVHRRIRDERGGTRADFMGIVVGVQLIALLAAPTLAGFKGASDHQICHANHRSLTRAWALYSEDNGGRLPGNTFGLGGSLDTNRIWVAGWLSLEPVSADNSNTRLISDAQMGRYADSVSIYRCPADRSLSGISVGVPRVRSVSMNGFVGEVYPGSADGYRVYRSMHSITAPSPSGLAVFLDEREETIGDGYFWIGMEGYSPQDPSILRMMSFPADRHEGGGTLSFADGHTESWQWTDPRTRAKSRDGRSLPVGFVHPGNRDIARLQTVFSRPIEP